MTLIHCFYCGNIFPTSEQAHYSDENNKWRPYEFVRCADCLSTRNTTYYKTERDMYAGRILLISPATTTPSTSGGVVSGGNDPLINERKPHHSWRCLIMEQQKKKKWLVTVSPAALIQSEYGWICDCLQWTFGDDNQHVPQDLSDDKKEVIP